jgi:PAS domain S-box-containing protein
MYKIDVEQLEDLKSLVIVLDKNGTILKFNEFAGESTGYNFDQVNATSWFDTFLSKNEKDEILIQFQEKLEKKISSWHFVCNIVCKDGTKKYINWTFSVLNDEDSDDGIVLGIGTDISITQELKSKDQLILQQSKMAAMGEMLETIAHQWRQPLSVISTAASGMKMKKEFEILKDEEFNESCDHIIEIVNHLSGTIDDFRNFFKPHKDKELFNLKDTIEKTFSLIGSKFVSSDIEVVYNLEDVQIHGFENELIQAFMVILNNAKDAFDFQGVKGKKFIFIDLYENEYNAVLKIKDSAGGIPEDIIHKIFNPYFTTKQETNGTGIGLYMTDEIISKHMKGHLTANNSEYVYEDEDYKGAEFIIELPSLKKEKIELKFLEELEACHCYRWNKDEEMFIKLPVCNDKMVLQDIATLSKFLYEFDIKFTILNNQNIQIHF